jgi:hypothetical protein
LIVRGNVVRDIEVGAGGNHAYYIDEGSQNCVVAGNLTVGVASPVSNHMARDNRIEDNVFVNDGDMALHFTRSTGYTLSRNVLYSTGQIVIHNSDAIAAFDQNIFFSGIGHIEARRYQADTYRLVAIEPIGESEDVRQGDPAFLNLAAGDYRFHTDSPANALGIRAQDFTQAGRSR